MLRSWRWPTRWPARSGRFWLTIDIACQRAGISRMTLFRAEAGSPAIALGTLLRILSVLGLEGDLGALAREVEVWLDADRIEAG